ncbi:hypothetical protein BJ138DRAFT_1072107, partial [Hygrophoropsis aurantiaca]
MGTRGYTVYRYKNYWFSTYQHCDSYPDALGENVLWQARGNLKKLIEKLERKISDLEAMSHIERERFLGLQDDANPLVISTAPDLRNSGIEWEYEIDLDRNLFHINRMPFFYLNNLPPPSIALRRLITRDSYGNQTCNDAQYRFESIQPPAFDEAVLQPYHQLLNNGQSAVSYTDMLGLSEHLTDGETLRMRFLQTIFGCSMDHTTDLGFGSIQDFRLVPDGDALSDRAWNDAFAIASIAFAPPIFFSWEDPHGCPRPPQRQDVCWIRNDVFIHITPHLSNENHMQAAIARVVSAVQKQDKENQGIVFGVLFSFLHCVILKIDTSQLGNAGELFTHTPPLSFLPSWFANEPSTPGITALARFGYCHPDPELFINWARGVADPNLVEPCSKPEDVNHESPTNSEDNEEHHDPIPYSWKIPLEIWHRVASFLPSIESLLIFGQVAKVCQHAAEMVLQCPHVDSWRLLAIVDD